MDINLWLNRKLICLKRLKIMYLNYLLVAQTNIQGRCKIFRIKCNHLKKDCQWVSWEMKSSPWRHCTIHLAKMICMIKCKIEITNRKMHSKDRKMRKNLNTMMKRKSRRFKLKLTRFLSLSDRNKTDIFYFFNY